MPKKFQGENSKSVVAKARKAEVKAVEAEKRQKAKEDAYWADDDKNLAKKLAKKEEEEKKRQEALKRKQDLKVAYEEDMKAAAATKAKATPPPKVTQAALLQRLEHERKLREEEEAKRQEAAKKIEVQAEEIHENLNRIDLDAHAARNVDEAIKVLESSGTLAAGVDKHPEKRLKSAYTAFEDARLASLKEEHPSLRLSQLKQMIRKEWIKSPENPLNQRSGMV